MNWARIDTRIADHPKVAPLPETVQWAYVKVILWCREWDTDGIVPARIPFRTFTSHRPHDARRQLIAARLLVVHDGDLIVPNFCSKQPPTDTEIRKRWAHDKRQQRSRTSQTHPDVHTDIDLTSRRHVQSSPRPTVRNGTERTTPPPTPSEKPGLERLDPSDFPIPTRRQP